MKKESEKRITQVEKRFTQSLAILPLRRSNGLPRKGLGGLDNSPNHSKRNHDDDDDQSVSFFSSSRGKARKKTNERNGPGESEKKQRVADISP